MCFRHDAAMACFQHDAAMACFQHDAAMACFRHDAAMACFRHDAESVLPARRCKIPGLAECRGRRRKGRNGRGDQRTDARSRHPTPRHSVPAGSAGALGVERPEIRSPDRRGMRGPLWHPLANRWEVHARLACALFRIRSSWTRFLLRIWPPPTTHPGRTAVRVLAVLLARGESLRKRPALGRTGPMRRCRQDWPDGGSSRVHPDAQERGNQGIRPRCRKSRQPFQPTRRRQLADPGAVRHQRSSAGFRERGQAEPSSTPPPRGFLPTTLPAASFVTAFPRLKVATGVPPRSRRRQVRFGPAAQDAGWAPLPTGGPRTNCTHRARRKTKLHSRLPTCGCCGRDCIAIGRGATAAAAKKPAPARMVARSTKFASRPAYSASCAHGCSSRNSPRPSTGRWPKSPRASTTAASATGSRRPGDT